MLEFMRQRTRSWLVYLLFGIIIAVFILTFNPWAGQAPTFGAGPGNPVLIEVGEHEIDLSTLQMGIALSAEAPRGAAGNPDAFQQDFLYRNTRFYFAGGNTDMLAFNPDPKSVSPIAMEKVARDLIETYVVSDLAEELGLAVSTEEITERILQGERFKDPATGRFDPETYTRFVRYSLRTTKPRYEEFLRRELLRERVIHATRALAAPATKEADYYVDLMTDRIDLEFVELDPSSVAQAVTVSDEDVARWADQNNPTIEKYYEDNQASYDVPERVKVRGFFKRAPLKFLRDKRDEAGKKAFDAEWETARAAADEARAAYDEALAGDAEADPTELFTKTVKEHSEFDSNKESGGVFAKPLSKEELGRWPFGPKVAEQAFGLEPGSVVGPIEGDNGYWVLRIDERLAASKQALNEARLDIARTLLREERAGEQLQALAGKLVAAAQAKASEGLEAALSDWAQANGLDEGAVPSVQTTGPVARIPEGGLPPATEKLGNIPRIGTSRALLEAAFQLTEEAPVVPKAHTVEGSESLYVVRLAEKVEATAEDKAGARERVERELALHRQRAAFRAMVAAKQRSLAEDGDIEFTDEYHELLTTERSNLGQIGALPGGPRS